MFFVDLSMNDEIPHCFDTRFVVDADSKVDLEEKLSKIYDSEIRVLFIDVLDMNGRDHDSEINGKYLSLKANIYNVNVF